MQQPEPGLVLDPGAPPGGGAPSGAPPQAGAETTSLLASFVPHALWQRVLAGSGSPRTVHFHGTILFTDVAGSTALAEHLLAEHGDDGPAELSRVFDRAFGTLIDETVRFGGEVVRYGGDSMIALWPADTVDPAETLRRAAACADALPAALSEAVQVGGHALEVRGGLAFGALSSALVGGVGGRSELVLWGPALEAAFQAASTAPRGGVRRSVSDAPPALPVEGAGAGAGDAPSAGPATTPGAPAPVDARMEDLVPPVVRTRLLAGLHDWLAEVRSVSVLFLNLDGIDFGSVGASGRLHETMIAVQRNVQECGGTEYQLMVDDKGLVALAAFGLPPLAREHRAEDALRAAVAIRSDLHALGVGVSAGVASGRVFCGPVGNDRRREYTLIGETVHLAARLANLARAEILCCEGTRLQAGERVRCEDLDAVTLKGFVRPVTPSRVVGFRGDDEGRDGLPLSLGTGREHEERLVIDLLRAGGAGEGRCVFFEGSPGLGKTTLLRSIAARAGSLGVRPLWLNADRYTRSQPYRAWSGALEALLGIRDLPPGPERRERALRALSGDEELERLAPLLGDFLPLDIAESGVTAAIEGVSRAVMAQEMIVRLLQRWGRGRPILLLVDDAQWLDGASWSLLIRGVSRVENALTVVAARPVQEAWSPEVQGFLDSRGVVRKRLGPLEGDGLERSVADLLGVRKLPPPLLEWLAGRAGGNPMFARELALALVLDRKLVVDAGEVVQSPAEATLAGLSLPPTLQSLVLGRIDGATPLQQILLKTASALGRTFRARELADVLDEAARGAPVEEGLDALVAAQLLERDGDSYTFVQQMAREAVYGTMLSEQRRVLHGRIARVLEGRGDVGPQALPLLAHHWSRAGDPVRTLHYLELAAEVAFQKGAYAETVTLLQRATEIDDETGRGVGNARRAHWDVLLGLAFEGMGRLAEANEHSSAALERLGRRLPRTMRGWRMLALREASLQLWHLALPFERIAPDSEEGLRSREILASAANLAELRYYSDDALGQIALTLLAANVADRLGDVRGVARPLAVLAAPAALLGKMGLARRYLERARNSARKSNDTSGLARTQIVTGAIHFWRGELHTARQALAEGETLAASHGLDREWAMIQAITLHVDDALGDYVTHARRALSLLEAARARSSAQGEVWGLIGRAVNAAMLGQLDRLEVALAELRPHAASLERQERSSYEGLELVLHLRQAKWQQVRISSDRLANVLGVDAGRVSRVWADWRPLWFLAEARVALLERAPEYERAQLVAEVERHWRVHERFCRAHPIARPSALLERGRALIAMGKVEQGRRALTESVGLGEALHIPLVSARARYAHAISLPSGDPRMRKELEEAHRILAGLGCEWDEQRVVGQLRREGWRAL